MDGAEIGLWVDENTQIQSKSLNIGRKWPPYYKKI